MSSFLVQALGKALSEAPLVIEGVTILETVVAEAAADLAQLQAGQTVTITNLPSIGGSVAGKAVKFVVKEVDVVPQ